MTHEMQWVWTDGGPLILLQADLLGEWYGIDPNPKDRSVTTDYERACQVQDYAGVIPVGDGSALVLGDEPMDATWWPSRDLAEAVIVRVSYCGGDEAVARLVESLRPESLTDTGLRMVITSPHLQLFDSTCPGTLDLVPRLAVSVPAGRYAVHSVVLRDPGSYMVVVHRLVRVGDTSGDERPPHAAPSTQQKPGDLRWEAGT